MHGAYVDRIYVMQHHNVTFSQRLVDLFVKSVDFRNLRCIMCQWGPFKKKKINFFLQILQACNSRSIKDILMPF